MKNIFNLFFKIIYFGIRVLIGLEYILIYSNDLANQIKNTYSQSHYYLNLLNPTVFQSIQDNMNSYNYFTNFLINPFLMWLIIVLLIIIGQIYLISQKHKLGYAIYYYFYSMLTSPLILILQNYYQRENIFTNYIKSDKTRKITSIIITFIYFIIIILGAYYLYYLYDYSFLLILIYIINSLLFITYTLPLNSEQLTVENIFNLQFINQENCKQYWHTLLKTCLFFIYIFIIYFGNYLISYYILEKILFGYSNSVIAFVSYIDILINIAYLGLGITFSYLCIYFIFENNYFKFVLLNIFILVVGGGVYWYDAQKFFNGDLPIIFIFHDEHMSGEFIDPLLGRLTARNAGIDINDIRTKQVTGYQISCNELDYCTKQAFLSNNILTLAQQDYLNIDIKENTILQKKNNFSIYDNVALENVRVSADISRFQELIEKSNRYLLNNLTIIPSKIEFEMYLKQIINTPLALLNIPNLDKIFKIYLQNLKINNITNLNFTGNLVQTLQMNNLLSLALYKYSFMNNSGLKLAIENYYKQYPLPEFTALSEKLQNINFIGHISGSMKIIDNFNNELIYGKDYEIRVFKTFSLKLSDKYSDISLNSSLARDYAENVNLFFHSDDENYLGAEFNITNHFNLTGLAIPETYTIVPILYHNFPNFKIIQGNLKSITLNATNSSINLGEIIIQIYDKALPITKLSMSAGNVYILAQDNQFFQFNKSVLPINKTSTTCLTNKTSHICNLIYFPNVKYFWDYDQQILIKDTPMFYGSGQFSNQLINGNLLLSGEKINGSIPVVFSGYYNNN